jgi:hypothetical protein
MRTWMIRSPQRAVTRIFGSSRAPRRSTWDHPRRSIPHPEGWAPREARGGWRRSDLSFPPRQARHSTCGNGNVAHSSVRKSRTYQLVANPNIPRLVRGVRVAVRIIWRPIRERRSQQPRSTNAVSSFGTIPWIGVQILPSRHDSLRSARLTGLDSANSSLTTSLAREMRIEGDPTTCERTLDRPKPYRRRR